MVNEDHSFVIQWHDMPWEPPRREAEAVQSEPVQPEPVQPEPVQPEPVQPEPEQSEPVQPESVASVAPWHGMQGADIEPWHFKRYLGDHMHCRSEYPTVIP